MEASKPIPTARFRLDAQNDTAAMATPVFGVYLGWFACYRCRAIILLAFVRPDGRQAGSLPCFTRACRLIAARHAAAHLKTLNVPDNNIQCLEYKHSMFLSISLNAFINNTQCFYQ